MVNALHTNEHNLIILLQLRRVAILYNYSSLEMSKIRNVDDSESTQKFDGNMVDPEHPDHPVYQQEFDKSDIDSKELAYYLHGGEQKYKKLIGK